MDEMSMKGGAVIRGMRFVVSWAFCAIETSDEGPSDILSGIRGRESRGDRIVWVGGPLRGTGDWERDGSDSLESEQVMGERSLG